MARLSDEDEARQERARDRAARQRLRELQQLEAHRAWLRGVIEKAIASSEQSHAGAYGVLGWLLSEACFERDEQDRLHERIAEQDAARGRREAKR